MNDNVVFADTKPLKLFAKLFNSVFTIAENSVRSTVNPFVALYDVYIRNRGNVPVCHAWRKYKSCNPLATNMQILASQEAENTHFAGTVGLALDTEESTSSWLWKGFKRTIDLTAEW